MSTPVSHSFILNVARMVSGGARQDKAFDVSITARTERGQQANQGVDPNASPAGAAFSSPLRALNPFGFPQSLVSNRHPSEVTTKAYAFAVGRPLGPLR